MTVIASSVVDLLRVAILLKVDIARVRRRSHLRFSNVVHVLLQGILDFVVLALALPVVLIRLHLHLGILVAGLLGLVVARREAALRASVIVPVGGTSALVPLQVVFTWLLRQVLALVLLEALILRLRATPHVAEGCRLIVVRAAVVVGVLLQIARSLLHLGRALTTATHRVPVLPVLLIAHSPVSCIRVREGHLLGHVGRTCVSWIVFIILAMRLVQVTLAVQVGVAVLHAGGRLLDLAGSQFLEIRNTRLEPLDALLLSSVCSGNLLLVDVVIVASVTCTMRWAAWSGLVLRLPASLAGLADTLRAVGGPTSAVVTKMRFHGRDLLD